MSHTDESLILAALQPWQRFILLCLENINSNMDSGWKHAVPVAVSGALLTNTKKVVVGLWEVDECATHIADQISQHAFTKKQGKKRFLLTVILRLIQ